MNNIFSFFQTMSTPTPDPLPVYRISGSHIKADSVKIIGDDNTIEGNYLEIRGHHNTLYISFSKIQGNGNMIVGDNNIVRGDHNKYIGERVTLQGGEHNMEYNTVQNGLLGMISQFFLPPILRGRGGWEEVVGGLPSLMKKRAIPSTPPKGGLRIPPAKEPIKAKEEETHCSVCLENQPNNVFIDCGHTFCNTCIRTILKDTDKSRIKCPLCNKVIVEGGMQIYM